MAPVRRDLPSGTVSFLFTDVEGSTKLLHELGADVYAEALAEHRRILRDAFGAHGGVEVDTQGDAFFVAFPTAPGALEAAAAALEGLAPGPIRVRMGIHTGTPHVAEEGYVGVDVHRAARIAAAGYGGQVVLSETTRNLVTAEVRDLGLHRLKDLAAVRRRRRALAVAVAGDDLDAAAADRRLAGRVRPRRPRQARLQPLRPLTPGSGLARLSA